MHTFAVLGPTEVRDGDRRVDLGGPLPRRLLTALVAAEGRPVSDDRLEEILWTRQRPVDPVTSIQVYVSRLRRTLGVGAKETLSRTAAGYRLVTEPAATDVERFTGQIGAARALTESGRPGEALPVFEAALQLWRGEAYADLGADPEAEALRAHLQELREAAEEARLDTWLATGEDTAGAIAELNHLVQAAPYRERRWALLVLSLYRASRQSEALEAVRRVRALLADQLGVNPGSELQSLEQRVLHHDPTLMLRSGQSDEPSPPTRPAPVLPAPVADSARPVRLLSSFIGRDTERALLADLFIDHRLVSVVGPPGTGKTRLAIEYTGNRTDIDDGLWLVRLADVTSESALPAVVATALRITESDRNPLESLVTALHGRAGLLVLDNCEHLIEDVAPFVVTLLDRVPGLRVLATSRSPLGTDGERLLPLGPLPPDDATALLIDRIRAARPTWNPKQDEYSQLRHLAAALDGIPLALELAAARTQVLSIRELIDHLDDRFAVLGPVPPGLLTPHATLHAAIAWSIDLLSERDRTLLLKLWPYEGGFPLEAIGTNALETLSSLVSNSVVVADTTETPTRYRLLETIRAYCRMIDPHPHTTTAAHATWIHNLATRCADDLHGPHSARAIRQLNPELPNIRAAITHDLTAAPETALRTAGRLTWFWNRNSLLSEGRRLLSAALAAAPNAPNTDIARAQAAYASLEYFGGDLDLARTLINTAAQSLTDHDDRTLYGELHCYQAMWQVSAGDEAVALAAATEAYRVGQQAGFDWLVASAEMAWGAALIMSGKIADGQEKLQLAARDAQACGLMWTAAVSELMLARVLLENADTSDEPLRLLRQALRRFVYEDDLHHILAVLKSGAVALTAAGHTERGALLHTAAHQLMVRHGIQFEQTYARTPTIEGFPNHSPESIPDQSPTLATTIALLHE